MTKQVRTPWQVTRSVWYALFLREALQRTMAERFSWFWMIVEPIAHVAMFIAIRELIGRIRVISGAEFIPWIIVGMMTFFVFREGFLRSIGAISANHGLFSYRQVKPVDTVIVRGMVEGLLKTLIFAILIMLLTFFDVECLPDDPLAVIKVWLNAWILGLGFGLFLSALNALVREVSIIVKVITLPMYFLSGVMLPFNFLPHEIQAYVLYNPVLHLVELNRGAFFENYNPVYGVNLEYAVLWSLITIALGLIMHLRFEFRIKAQ